MLDCTGSTVFIPLSQIHYLKLIPNWTFSLWCVQLTKSGSLNWPWSTKILGQCDVKHILTSPIKTITPVLKISTCIITSDTARPVRLAELLVIMSRPLKLLLYYIYVMCVGILLREKQKNCQSNSNTVRLNEQTFI